MMIQRQQFAENVEVYEKLIITICLTFTKNYFDAEDLAQETFLAAYQHWNSFDGGNLKAWLTRIAVNKCKDYLKSSARKVNYLEDEGLESLESGEKTPQQALQDRESQERVHRLCTRLDEPYRSVATAYFCRDQKLSEISARTGKNLKTMQTQLYRAKKKLRELWKEETE